ncbi:hypothetical protein X777_07291 [Ooceraea biroi]|uniref:Uncharacterized protein n=1 Tax=Ooceraea biroi TaxID=2015173 RepID=A0A026WB05_OOCBI|nr:hypothetical protein X777_07291 [Ooceraea biroi]
MDDALIALALYVSVIVIEFISMEIRGISRKSWRQYKNKEKQRNTNKLFDNTPDYAFAQILEIGSFFFFFLFCFV